MAMAISLRAHTPVPYSGDSHRVGVRVRVLSAAIKLGSLCRHVTVTRAPQTPRRSTSVIASLSTKQPPPLHSQQPSSELSRLVRNQLNLALLSDLPLALTKLTTTTPRPQLPSDTRHQPCPPSARAPASVPPARRCSSVRRSLLRSAPSRPPPAAPAVAAPRSTTPRPAGCLACVRARSTRRKGGRTSSSMASTGHLPCLPSRMRSSLIRREFPLGLWVMC